MSALPPAPTGMPTAVQPAAAALSAPAGGAQTAGAPSAAPATPPGAAAAPPFTGSPGCFRLDVRRNAIQYDYDPTAQGQITQDQLDLLAQVSKTEAALQAIFFPDGLPADLSLRKPAGPVHRDPHHAAKVGHSVATVSSSQTAREQHKAEEQEDEEAQKLAGKDSKMRRGEKDKAKFRSYFYRLFFLAQVGLDGPKAQPLLARTSLASLKDQILTLEGGRIKNGYMERLGIAALGLGGIPLVLLLLREIVRCLAPDWPALPTKYVYLYPLFAVMLYAWVGAVVGTFLSFAMRNPVLSFDQLATPEDDRLKPRMRLVYTGLLTLVFTAALLFHIFTVAVGSLTSVDLLKEPAIALIVGVFCGLSERAIGDKMLRSADALGK